MRKLYSIPVVLLCMIIGLQSCSKKSAKEMVVQPSPKVINATIAPNQGYKFTVSNSGDVIIAKQASHYKISQAGTDAKSGLVAYEYVPAQDYTGKDEVVLSSKVIIYSSEKGVVSGCSSSHVVDNPLSVSYTTSYISIRITIAN